MSSHPVVDPAADAAIASFLAGGSPAGAPQASAGSANPRPRRKSSGRSSKPNSGRNKASAASRPLKTPQSAAPTTPQPAATAPKNKKGTKMPSSADIEAAAQAKLRAAADADSTAYAYFRTWLNQPNKAYQDAVAATVPKANRKAFLALVKKHNDEEGDADEKGKGGKKADPKLVKKAKEILKKKDEADTFASLSGKGYTDDQINAAIKAAQKKGS